MSLSSALLVTIILGVGLAYVPLYQAGFHEFSFVGVVSCYSIGNSNLDVAAVSLFYSLVIFACIIWGKKLVDRIRGRNRVASGAPEFSLGIHAAWTANVIFQLLLLGKAVVVAILGDEVLWPADTEHCGLAYMYVSLISQFFASLWVHAACQASFARMQEEAEQMIGPDDPLQQPLLRTGSSMSQKKSGRDTKDKSDVQHATIMALVKFAIPDSFLLTLAFMAGSLAALGQALLPYYTGKIIDYASIDPDEKLFKYTTLKMIVVALLCAIFTGCRGGLFTYAMTRLNVRLRKKLFSSLLKQDSGFYDTTRTGDITSRLSADTTTVSDQICLNLNIMMRSLTQAAMVLVFMFLASWRLTVVTFVMIPVVLVVCKVYGSYYRKLSKTVQTKLAEANSVAEEAISTMTTVKAHAAQGSTEQAYSSRLGEFYHVQVKQAMAYAAYMTNNTFLTAAVTAGVLFYGGNLVLGSTMSAGSLVSFMLYQQSLSASFQALGDVFSALSAAVGAADKVVELINREPDFIDSGLERPDTFSGRLELRNVTFSYPARPNTIVLRDFSLQVNPGEVVALVGPSGGGKSSIVKLLERQYLPSTGSVLIDGRDLGTFDPSWLRRKMALVSQEPVLYARSIRRNIIYGMEVEDGLAEHEVPTQEMIENAARRANAHEFIMALPEGYDTESGERGVQLSGGQKQRLAIARALVRDPVVLLLDEATSALDSDSEAIVQEALDRTMVGRTVLVIAHRLSTVQDADRIIVIQKGSIVETGTHDELLDRQGAYANLVRRQLARSTSSASMAAGLTPSASATQLLQ